ncbi:hypothetical protein JCM8208_000541 [Rhodotorula glutinis]
MRVKRWAPAPVPLPPAPPRPAAAAAPRPRPPSPPRLDRRRNKRPAARPQPSTSQQRLEQYHQSVWPTVQRVRDLLRPLARPDPVAKPPPLRQQLSTHLELELAQRRAACTQIHVLLRHARNKAAAAAAANAAASDRKGKGKARDDEPEGAAAAAVPPWVERQVVHLVAQTMRLQLHLGDVSSAKELDRAFFSLESHAAAKRAFRLSRKAHPQQQQVDGKAARALRLGAGLGLDRGDAEPAWMQSLAVRLRAGADPARALERFLGLYRAFRASRIGAHERGEADWEAYVRARTARQDDDEGHGGGERGDERLGESHVLAFLARRMGTLQRRVEDAAPRLSPSRAGRVHAQLRRFMDELRAAEEDEGEVVALALLESSLERLEASEHLELDDPLYRQVEEDVERLVASLGNVLALDGARAVARAGAPSRRPEWVELERRAQALHIAIRFLLVRARSHDSPSSSPHASTSAPIRTSATGSPLASASQLYLLLLDLTHSTASDPLLAATALPRLRLRQSSVLFRLASAHLDALAAAQHGRRRSSPHPSTADDPLAPLERLHTLLSASLSTLSRLPLSPAVPASTRRLGLSTHVLRAALLALGSAFDPANPARKDAMPRFDAVRDACDVLLACKEHDAALRGGPHEPVGLALPPPPSNAAGQGVGAARAVEPPQLPQKGRADQPLLRRVDAAGALVRAALLAESSSSSGSRSEAGALGPQDDVRSRLDWLLDWVARLQRASPAPQGAAAAAAASSGSVRAPSTTTERKARRTVARAVGRTMERAWGAGEGGRAWREGLLRRVDEWVDEGEREWGALDEGGLEPDDASNHDAPP